MERAQAGKALVSDAHQFSMPLGSRLPLFLCVYVYVPLKQQLAVDTAQEPDSTPLYWHCYWLPLSLFLSPLVSSPLFFFFFSALLALSPQSPSSSGTLSLSLSLLLSLPLLRLAFSFYLTNIHIWQADTRSLALALTVDSHALSLSLFLSRFHTNSLQPQAVKVHAKYKHSSF